MAELNLLRECPKAKRNIARRHQAQEDNRAIARQFGEAFFDGERDQGYGGESHYGGGGPGAQGFLEHRKL